MKRFRALTTLCLAAGLLFYAAGCADLAVNNLNDPDTERVLADPSDIQTLPAGAMVTWFQASNTIFHPWFALLTAGDQFTASWGNWGMQAVSSLPRVAYTNTLTSTERAVAEDPWYQFYSAVATANDVLLRVEAGAVIEDEATTQMVKASSHLVTGLSHGYIALLFDQGYVLSPEVQQQVTGGELEATEVPFAPHPEVMAFAINQLDLAIQAADAAASLEPGITMPETYINGYTIDMNQLKQMASSFAARFLTYQARTPAENEQTDWGRVLAYAQNGFDFTFAPMGDGSVWFSYVQMYGSRSTWVRLDQRVVHMIDPSQPVPYPNNTSQIPPADSTLDARLTTYFDYIPTVGFDPARGYYHFGHYLRTRSDMWFGNLLEPMPIFTVSEINLMKAEALLRSGGSKQQAADLINISRVGAGEKEPVTASMSTQELLDAMYYERFLEIDYFGIGQGFFDRRRFGTLVEGTFRQLPVPAAELSLRGAEFYTFDGDAGGGGDNSASYTVLALPNAEPLQRLRPAPHRF